MNVRPYIHTFIGDVALMNICDYVHRFHVMDERMIELMWQSGRGRVARMLVG
jgi:hypothetical protein